MATKLKTKIALGSIFLFALLIIVGAVSFFYFHRLTNDVKEIVKDNYETLNFSRDLLRELDAINGKDSTAAYANFEKQLEHRKKTSPNRKKKI